MELKAERRRTARAVANISVVLQRRVIHIFTGAEVGVRSIDSPTKHMNVYHFYVVAKIHQNFHEILSFPQ